MASRTADEVGPFTNLMRLLFKNILMHVCITLGVFGNILTLVVLLQKKMRRTSTAQYLAALTLFDLIYIICSFLNNLEIIYPNGKLISQNIPFLNLILYPLGDFSANTSVYLILVFTIERYIAVAYPLNSLFWCRPSRARKIILFTILFAFLLTFPTFLENKIIYVWEPSLNATRAQLTETELYHNFNLYKLIYFWIIAITVQFIPLTVLIILNYILMRYIHLSMKIKNSVISKSHSLPSDNKNSSKNLFLESTYELCEEKKTKKQSVDLRVHRNTNSSTSNCKVSTQQTDQNKATILLIATVLLFLICQLPSASLLIYEAIFPLDDQTSKLNRDVRLGLNNIANGLTAINASVNFVLYSCFSEKFRQTFQELFSISNKRKQNSVPTVQANKFVAYNRFKVVKNLNRDSN